jgi:hypothetical protein
VTITLIGLFAAEQCAYGSSVMALLYGERPDLMGLNNWRAVQPDVERSSLIFAANDHAAKSCSVWWAGPGTEFLDRMRAEARDSVCR